MNAPVSVPTALDPEEPLPREAASEVSRELGPALAVSGPDGAPLPNGWLDCVSPCVLGGRVLPSSALAAAAELLAEDTSVALDALVMGPTAFEPPFEQLAKHHATPATATILAMLH